MKNLLIFALASTMFACGNSSSDAKESASEEAKDTVAEVVVEKEQVIDEIYMLDSALTSVKWVGSKPTESHYGTIKPYRGALNKAEGSFVDGIIQLDMSTIKCDDIENEGKNAKLVGHLKNKDFFNVEEFPTCIFHAKEIDVVEDGVMNIGAELTIKGITQQINVELPFNTKGDTLTVLGDIEFDRTLFDIKYKSKTIFPELADKFINDEILIQIEAVFVKEL